MGNLKYFLPDIRENKEGKGIKKETLNVLRRAVKAKGYNINADDKVFSEILNDVCDIEEVHKIEDAMAERRRLNKKMKEFELEIKEIGDLLGLGK